MSGVERPSVDVVVPFLGSDAALQGVAASLVILDLGESDSCVIVDNSPSARSDRVVNGSVRVIAAGAQQTSYFARNAGFRHGSNPWIIFLDGDVRPSPELLERYELNRAAARSGVLAGSIVDAPAEGEGNSRLAVRYALSRQALSQENTLHDPRWSYAQTANCAVRREALEQVGGFRDDLRSGGDADLMFRLRRAGWSLERRDAATVRHLSRPRLRKMLAQRARHGAGAAWLNRTYPGAFPATPTSDLARYAVRSMESAVRDALSGRREKATLDLLDVASTYAFECGRRLPNEPNPSPGRLPGLLERVLIG